MLSVILIPPTIFKISRQLRYWVTNGKIKNQNRAINPERSCWNSQAVTVDNLLTNLGHLNHANQNHQGRSLNHPCHQVNSLRQQATQDLWNNHIGIELPIGQAKGPSALKLVSR